MKLNVPLRRQPKGSVLCGPTCLQMLYSYYGKDISRKDILKDVRLYKIGSYEADLGISLLKKGFDATICFMDVRCVPREYEHKSQKNLLEWFKRRKKSGKGNKSFLRGMISFLEMGGKVKISRVTWGEIYKAMKAGYPPIMCIDRKTLYGRGLKEEGHFVIPVGVTGKTVIINDSSSIHGGRKKYNTEDVMYALHSWKGYVLFAKPKKKHKTLS